MCTEAAGKGNRYIKGTWFRFISIQTVSGIVGIHVHPYKSYHTLDDAPIFLRGDKFKVVPPEFDEDVPTFDED